MGVGDQSEPFGAGLPTRPVPWNAVLVPDPLLGLPPRIHPAVHGTGEDLGDGPIARPPPIGAPAGRVHQELQAVLQEPPERLPDRAQRGELPEH
jgi:hypothetical protein